MISYTSFWMTRYVGIYQLLDDKIRRQWQIKTSNLKEKVRMLEDELRKKDLKENGRKLRLHSKKEYLEKLNKERGSQWGNEEETSQNKMEIKIISAMDTEEVNFSQSISDNLLTLLAGNTEILKNILWVLTIDNDMDRKKWERITKKIRNYEDRNHFLIKIGFNKKFIKVVDQFCKCYINNGSYTKRWMEVIDKYYFQALTTLGEVDSTVSRITRERPDLAESDNIRLYLLLKNGPQEKTVTVSMSIPEGKKPANWSMPDLSWQKLLCTSSSQGQVGTEQGWQIAFRGGAKYTSEKIAAASKGQLSNELIIKCLDHIKKNFDMKNTHNREFQTQQTFVEQGIREYPVYHISKGVRGTFKTCTLFFIINGQGEVIIIAAGRHERYSAHDISNRYSLYWKYPGIDIPTSLNISVPCQFLNKSEQPLFAPDL